MRKDWEGGGELRWLEEGVFEGEEKRRKIPRKEKKRATGLCSIFREREEILFV